MNNNSLSKDFTKGKIARQVFLLALPFMASNALQVLYSTIDMVIVGEYVGTPGLSAVSQSSQILNFVTMVCLGFSSAGQVLLAQAIGAGKRKEMNDIIGTLFSFIAIISLAMTGIAVFGCDPILNLMNMPAESYDMAKDYLIICGAGLILTAGYNVVSAILRGMGDARRPFLFIAIASVINLVLDLLFIGVLDWGVAGAAWATIIGQAVSFIFSIYYLYKRKESFGFDFKLKSFLINKKYMKMMAVIGTPMAIQSGCINLSMLFVNSMINGIGVVESATFGVGIRINDIINKLSQGIQYAAMPIISQNIGAGEQKRAKQTVYWAWVYSLAFTTICVLLYVLFGKQLFMAFSDDVLVHEMSGTFIKAILVMFPALAVMRGSGAFVQGIGEAKLSMLLALLDGVILRIGLSWLFGIVLDQGFFGFVLGYAFAPYGYAVPSMLYFLSGIWKKRKVLAEDI